MARNWIRGACAVLGLLCAQQAAAAVSPQPAPAQVESPPRAHLRQGDFTWLDQYFDALQRQFESGRMSEFDLRGAYRPLYDLDDPGVAQLQAWAEHSPSSYAAHLLLGIHHKRLGSAARGEDSIQETPRAALEEMHRQFQLAMPELERSSRLTAKPYLSWFFMMAIATDEGRAEQAREILERSVQQYPLSELLRVRYMGSLTPRWGGSYPQMEAFIARNRKEGMPDRLIHELQAMEEDDKGESLADAGDRRGARVHFEKALRLAKDSAPFFLKDSMAYTRYELCQAGKPAAGCP